MTDEQWVWLYVNMIIDDDETREHMCHKCISDMESNRCVRCGTLIYDDDHFVNPNFDDSRFEELSGDDGVVMSKNFDADKFDRLDGGDN